VLAIVKDNASNMALEVKKLFKDFTVEKIKMLNQMVP